MQNLELPPESNLAFHSADKTKIQAAVKAAMKELGLAQGSVTAKANIYAAYDLYSLLRVYMTDPEKRIEIHKIIGILERN